jgi:hypothetical protein
MDFGTVIWLVVLMSAPLAAVLFVHAWEQLDDLGRDGLALEDVPLRPPPARPAIRPQSPIAAAEREAEIRQILQARNDRRQRLGKEPFDLDAEVERLLAIDPEQAGPGRPGDALREEVRQLVIARNDRRAARGEPALDIEAEVARQLASLPR